MKYLRIHNISIHINFYQNQFINECARKERKGEIWEKEIDRERESGR